MKKMNKNATIEKVIDEMNCTKRLLEKNGISFIEEYGDAYGMDLYYLELDKIEELEGKYYNQYDLSLSKERYDREFQPLFKTTLEDYSGNSYDCEFNLIKWVINSNKSVKKVNFSSNGDIIYMNSARGKNRDNTYSIKYNVNSNNINISNYNNRESLLINICDELLMIDFNNLKLVVDVCSCIKKITYEDNYNEGIKVMFEIVLNEYNEIASKRIEIKNYEDGMLVSTYNLDYDGDKLYNATVTYEESLERRSILADEEILHMINRIIESFIINNKDLYYEEVELDRLTERIKDMACKYIKSIKNDILLVGIGDRLDNAMSMIKMNVNKERKKEEKRYSRK